MAHWLRATLLVLAVALGADLVAQDTTVVLLRHAERQSLMDDDSPLSATGLRRAEALAPLLGAFRPVGIFASDRQRTAQTLAPTARQLGLGPLLRSKADSAGLGAEILREHRGQTVLVCWHHDLMKPLARALGFQGPVPHWSTFTYDQLWILRIPPKGAVTLEARGQGF